MAAGVAVIMPTAGAGPATAVVRPRATTRVPIVTMTITFVDTSRSTPATPTQPGDDKRVLVTTIRYPRDATSPLPLIVLAHGLNGHPHQLDELIDAWAHAGFVVATPLFPRTNVNDQGKAVLADAAEYPGDLSFVITRVLAMSSADTPGPLQNRVDPRRIGAGGISLGGMAVYGLVSNSCCLDRRVDAAILMSAVRSEFPSGTYVRQKIPVMLIHGDDDTGYRYSERAYPTLAAPKWFITLSGGRHGPPFEDEPDDFDDFVRATTTAFWDRYLDDTRGAAARIVSEVAASRGTAKLQRDLG
jgi:poly(3-hydroxybutyrate) depolymerase